MKQQNKIESPLDSKKIKPVNPKGNQSWIFVGRTHAEAEAPILWPSDAKNCLTGNDPDAGKDWRQEEKGTTEDEMVGWHHWLHGHELEQALGVGDGQGSLACCSSWDCKESDMTEWTELRFYKEFCRENASSVQFAFLLHRKGEEKSPRWNNRIRLRVLLLYQQSNRNQLNSSGPKYSKAPST